MDTLKAVLYSEINGFGIIVLLMMYFGFGGGIRRKNELDVKLFRWLLIINIIVLLSDMITWIIDGATFPFAREINIAAVVIYYISQPLMCMVWLMYCDYMLNSDRDRLIKRLPVYSIPLIAITAASVASVFTPLLFSVDQANKYHREDYYLAGVLCAMLYIVFSVILTFTRTKRSKTSRHRLMRRFFVLFPVLPVIGIIIQSLFYGAALTWVLSVISLLIIFFNLQNQQVTTDFLTGLNNRGRFESFIEDKVANANDLPLSFIMMIDVDHFKKINDGFGHAEGDRALRIIADTLRRCVQSNDFIARVGGDEFVVVGDRNTEEDIKTLRDKIIAMSDLTNDGSFPYKLSLSTGYAIIEKGQVNYDAVYRLADARMYENKKDKPF